MDDAGLHITREASLVLLHHRAISDIAAYADMETERANNAENRLRLAKQALVATGYFTEEQVGDDIAPRITEYASFMESALEQATNPPSKGD